MQNIIKAHCNNCLGERNHEVLYSISKDETYKVPAGDGMEGFIVYTSDSYNMLKCCGCDRISLMHRQTSSDIEFGNANLDETIQYYPPAVSRPIPKWLTELDVLGNKEHKIISDLTKEIYAALYNGSIRLATMGLRSLLEQIMISKVGDNGPFATNLDLFQKNGFISEAQKGLLKTVLEIGHATTHRFYRPTTEDLITAISICENVIELLYVHSSKADSINKKLPKRNHI
jgi:hypothetical protein